MNELKTFYIVIPANILCDDGLTAKCQILYGHISALCSSNGTCWATNSYLSKAVRVDKTTISKMISVLEHRGHIETRLEKNESGEVINRFIKIPTPMSQIANTPMSQIAKDIVVNNTEENITASVTPSASKLEAVNNAPEAQKTAPIGKDMWDAGKSELQRFVAYYVRSEMPSLYANATKSQVSGFFRQYSALFSKLLATAGGIDNACKSLDCARKYYNRLGYSWGLKALNNSWVDFVNEAMNGRR